MRSVARFEQLVRAGSRHHWTQTAGGRPHGDSPRSLITCAGNGKHAGVAVMHLVSLLFHDVYRSDPSESGFCSPGADRYKLTVERFAAQLDGVAAACDAFPFLITVDDGGVS